MAVPSQNPDRQSPESPAARLAPMARGEPPRPVAGGTAPADAAAQGPPAEPITTAAPPHPDRHLDRLLDQAQEALASVDGPSEGPVEGLATYHLAELAAEPAPEERATIDLVRDVEMDLKIELGRTQMPLEEVLKLRKGSVVTLDKLAGDPVDVYVNGRLIARGEVLVLNDNFCVRVGELVAEDFA